MTSYNKLYAIETPINQNDFKKFINGDMTMKESKIFQKEFLEKRFYYIVHTIGKLSGFDVQWFDYSNEGGENRRGYFDPDYYRNTVKYVGEFSYIKSQPNFERFTYYNDSFPTNWFIEDFEPQLQQEIEQFQQELIKQKTLEKQKKQEQQTLISKAQQSIQSKLTQEELTYIVFATPEQVEQNQKKLKAIVAKEKKSFKKP
jgi:hypothetical protein